jgi:hypothetical protein
MGDSEAIDGSVPSAERIYDFLLGGSNHFEVDRQAAAMAFAGIEGGLAGAQEQIQQNRLFLVRVVEWLAGEGGIRQFLDVGTGIPMRTTGPAFSTSKPSPTATNRFACCTLTTRLLRWRPVLAR